jgi:hypothetical protein
MWLVSAQSVANEIDNAEEVRARLYVRGQALIREVNEQIHRLDPEWTSEGGRCSIICECVNSECLAALQIPSQVYAAVRRFPTRFVLAPEHVADAFERVVEDGGNYVVVEKIGAAAGLAVRLDPRRIGIVNDGNRAG